jgi:PAS domain S-box-containing protein
VTPFNPLEPPHDARAVCQILDGIDDGILLIDDEYEIVWANLALRRMLGVPEADLDEVTSALRAATGDLRGRILAELEDGGVIPEFECRIQNPGGGERCCLCSGQKISPGAGWVIWFRKPPDEKGSPGDARDYEEIVEYTGTATVLIEGDGTISVANTEFERLSGYRRQEIVGVKRLTDFITGADERRRIRDYHALRWSNTAVAPKNDAFNFTDRFGNTHAVEATISLVPGTLRSVMSLRDVTEQRQAEKALQESEERLNLALSAANDGLIDWNVGAGTIFYSPRCFTMLGYEPGGFTPTLPAILSLVHPTDRARVKATLHGIATGEHERCEMEFRMRSASGEWVYVYSRLQVASRGAGGKPLRIVGTHTDITSRKETEEQLRFQALVLSQVDDAVIAVDTEGRITYMNPAAERLYDISLDEARDRPNSEIFAHRWLSHNDRRDAQKALLNSGTWRGVTVHRKRDGGAIFVDATISTLNNKRGAITGMLFSLRNITEQRCADLELRIKDMAIASSLDAITLTDLEGRIIYVNHAAITAHGWERAEDLIGEPASVFWADPEDTGRIRRAVRENGTWFGEVMARRQDGTTFPMQLAFSVVTDEAGGPLCMMGSGIDITKRKMAEQELRILDMAIASALNAFVIADLDGCLTYVNHAFLAMWGYDSTAEVLGKLVTEFWHDEEDARDALQTLLETGRYVGERIGRRRDGTLFHATFSGNRVTSETGIPICLMASIADITDQKRAEAEIQAHNRELSVLNRIIGVSASATEIDEALEGVLAATIALLDLAGGEIYLIDPDRRRARLICIQGLPEGPPGHSCIQDITVPPYAWVLIEGRATFVDETPAYASIPIVAPGGVVGALNVIPREGRQFTDADRSLLVAIGREIGSSIERTMLIQQLESAQQEANLYLDILSHDIRNAENVSSLYTDLLINMLEGEAKGYAQRIRNSIRKSIEILRNVSTIRRIHHESTVLVPLDLDRVIRDEIEMFPEIRFHYSRTDLMIMADALLPEVFTNLIGNAIKFGGPGIEVTIRVEEIGDDVLVSVEDTGPGIPDDMKVAVFMRFGQSKNRKSGQGLGLYITRMLITRYGGQVWVEDRVPGYPGGGAAFRFTLKRAPEQDAGMR